MNKIFCMFLIFSVTVSAFSQWITIEGEAPTSSDSTINNALSSAFNDLKGELRKEIGKLDNAPPEGLIRAFGNASVYASHGATQRGYGGYKKFTVTLGPSLGFQLPISPFQIIDLFSAESNPLEGIFDEGDITFGFNPQIINAQIGFNTSFLLKNMYLGLRVGFTPDIGNMIGDMMGEMGGLKFSFSNFLIGITANYQLIDSMGIAGLLTWRGVNLGTGFLFQNTKTNITYSIDPIEQTLEGSYSNTSLKVNPSLSFNMDITTFTIPLEAMTAINLLIFNIPLGVGGDFAFGTSKMGIGMHSVIEIIGNSESIGTTTPGYLAIKAAGEARPTFANLKLMTGIGFSIGHVIIDIPVTWYFLDNGLNIGFTAGLSF